MKDWLNSIWSKVGGLLRKRNLLVWVKRVLRNSHTGVAVIPGGMTNLLQALDVSANKPCKDTIYYNIGTSGC